MGQKERDGDRHYWSLSRAASGSPVHAIEHLVHQSLQGRVIEEVDLLVGGS